MNYVLAKHCHRIPKKLHLHRNLDPTNNQLAYYTIINCPNNATGKTIQTFLTYCLN